MKRLRDLQKGDTIWIKCPIEDGVWTAETVTGIITGENYYPGSNELYMRIQTNKSVSTNSDADARNGKHWSILLLRYSLTQDTSDASGNVQMLVSAVDPNEIEMAKPSLIDIIKESKIVDLRKMEELPQEAYIVGMNNNNWSCEHLYNMKHCELSRTKNEYGGQYGRKVNKETGEIEYSGWWTMNYNFSNFRSEYMFIVKDYDTGTRLAELLKLIGNDWLDIEGAINKRQQEIERINSEITLIESIADVLKEKPNEA